MLSAANLPVEESRGRGASGGVCRRMEFGRHDDASAVDFTLPDPDPRSVDLLARHGPCAPRVRFGMPRWTGGLDQRGTSHERLSAYAEHFPAIELNVSFHAVPEARVVAGWASAVPASFRFCPKVPRTVSHEPGAWRADAGRFAEVLPHFGDRLGPCFFQAPPEVGPSDEAELFARLGSVPTACALEVRHPAFFRGGVLADRLFGRLAAAGVGTVVTDTPGRRDVVHGTLTSPTLFLRFMADAAHPTTGPRLAAWAERVRWWGERGLRDVYVFVHHPDNLRLPELVALVRAAFGDLCVATEPPRQRGLFG
jgi:uncharacterized protein YecE (DUF72 family)